MSIRMRSSNYGGGWTMDAIWRRRQFLIAVSYAVSVRFRRY